MGGGYNCIIPIELFRPGRAKGYIRHCPPRIVLPGLRLIATATPNYGATKVRRFVFVPGAVAALVICLTISATPLARADGLSEQQGKAILNELRQIRQILERMERRNISVTPRKGSRSRPANAKVSSKGRPALGAANAPVTLVEFTDYQCPYCKRFFDTTFPKLKSKYIDTGKVRLVVKDLPLPFHVHARKAALAAHCAGDQGRFWDMHHVLYKNAGKLEEAALSKYAAGLALDTKKFRDCLESGKHRKAIEADIAQARAAGIRGTPAFVLGATTDDFVEGKYIRGAQKFATFESEINRVLRRIAKRQLQRP